MHELSDSEMANIKKGANLLYTHAFLTKERDSTPGSLEHVCKDEIVIGQKRFKLTLQLAELR